MLGGKGFFGWQKEPAMASDSPDFGLRAGGKVKNHVEHKDEPGLTNTLLKVTGKGGGKIRERVELENGREKD